MGSLLFFAVGFARVAPRFAAVLGVEAGEFAQFTDGRGFVMAGRQGAKVAK